MVIGRENNFIKVRLNSNSACLEERRNRFMFLILIYKIHLCKDMGEQEHIAEIQYRLSLSFTTDNISKNRVGNKILSP